MMTLARFVIFSRLLGPPLSPAGILSWCTCSLFALMTGFLTAYPVNRWLISRGIEEVM